MTNITTSDFAYHIHQTMEQENVHLCYTGGFTPELINVLLLMAKKNVDERGVLKKVYNIMIESLENVTRHAIKSNDEKYPAIFVIGKDAEHHYLATGNKIDKADRTDLEKRLQKINSLDKAGLRAWYNEILQNGNMPTDNSGAGLGIIDIALKSGNPLDYKFEEMEGDANNLFFVLKIKVSKNQ